MTYTGIIMIYCCLKCLWSFFCVDIIADRHLELTMIVINGRYVVSLCFPTFTQIKAKMHTQEITRKGP